MKTFLPLALLIACAPDAPESAAVVGDAQVLAQAKKVVEPGPLLDLVAALEGERFDELGDVELSGSLTAQDTETGSWIAGEDFRVTIDGELRFHLDGAIELQDVGELLFIDTTATICDELLTQAWSCEDDGLTMDLHHTLFPTTTYPERYDASVSGAVEAGDEMMVVEGSWSIDTATCVQEPTNGTLTARLGEHHAIDWDGQAICDGCAPWAIQGEPIATWCAVE
jgi:hypothetical protein